MGCWIVYLESKLLSTVLCNLAQVSFSHVPPTVPSTRKKELFPSYACACTCVAPVHMCFFLCLWSWSWSWFCACACAMLMLMIASYVWTSAYCVLLLEFRRTLSLPHSRTPALDKKSTAKLFSIRSLGSDKLMFKKTAASIVNIFQSGFSCEAVRPFWSHLSVISNHLRNWKYKQPIF